MLSMPPVIIKSASPQRIIWSAMTRALMLDMQTLFRFITGRSMGKPAFSEACRAGIWPTPPVMTWPINRYSSSSVGTVDLATASLAATAPSSTAGTSARAPPSRPKAVLAIPTITVSAKSINLLGQST